MDPVSAALCTIDHAISRAGGAKIMLRLEEALAIRAVLMGERPPAGGPRVEDLPCACGFRDLKCEHRRAG